MAKIDVDQETGALRLDEDFFPVGEETFRGRRVQQVRLEGGDASTD